MSDEDTGGAAGADFVSVGVAAGLLSKDAATGAGLSFESQVDLASVLDFAMLSDFGLAA